MPDLMELIRQEGLFEGTFAHETGNRNEPLRHCEGFYELPDNAQKLISEIRRGEKTSVLLYLKNAFLLFEHKEGGEPDPSNNNKRLGYQLYRYSLENYPGLSETLLSETLSKKIRAESISENQKDSFEKTETPRTDELVREIKQLAELVRDNEQHKLSEQESFDKAEKQVLDELVREVRQLSELVRDHESTQLPEKPHDNYHSPVSVFFAPQILWFIVTIITLLVGSFGVLIYNKADNIEAILDKNCFGNVTTSQNREMQITLLEKPAPLTTPVPDDENQIFYAMANLIAQEAVKKLV
ncbi:MAG: hypothetical protein VSS75_003490, partial [Candidatus Parabeggiatoa sp.]|nr:hypothetical protein [Candidatus Parabeggiatoa sp.]